MPLSFGAAVIDFLFGSSTLCRVVGLGDRFERWVHLYAALEEEAETEGPNGNHRSLDTLLNEAADGIEKKAANGPLKDTDTSQANS